MRDPITRLFDLWNGRRADPKPEAIAAVAGRSPAAVVTGASRGIGLALAKRFARAGHPLLLLARESEKLRAAADEIASTHDVAAVPLALDVTTPNAWEQIEAELDRHGLFCDILLNNAGIGLSGRFDTLDAADIERLISLNVTAATRLMHRALVPMLARGRGGILNVASLGGLVPGPNQAAYYASKAYVVSLTEAVAHEISGRGVRVAAVAPGPVATGFHAAMGADGARYRVLVPAISPERVANSAFLGFAWGRTVIVPGLLPSAAALAVKVLPHALTVPIVGALLGDGADRPPLGPHSGDAA
jgi:hypothetical protein